VSSHAQDSPVKDHWSQAELLQVLPPRMSMVNLARRLVVSFNARLPFLTLVIVSVFGYRYDMERLLWMTGSFSVTMRILGRAFPESIALTDASLTSQQQKCD
jgi:hypothetical protein